MVRETARLVDLLPVGWLLTLALTLVMVTCKLNADIPLYVMPIIVKQINANFDSMIVGYLVNLLSVLSWGRSDVLSLLLLLLLSPRTTVS